MNDFLAGLFENCSKNFDLGDNTAPNIDEHQKKLPLYGGFLLHSDYNVFYDRTIGYKDYPDKIVPELTTVLFPK